MTTQNDSVFGFGNSTSTAYPTDRLINFLNVNPTKVDEIKKFSKKYKLLLPGNLKDQVSNFQIEQRRLKEVVIKATQEKLTKTEINLINDHIGGIKQQVRLMTEEELLNINKVIPRLEGQFEKVGKQFLVLTKKHKSTLSSLWEDFVKYSISLQRLGQCSNCGQFFTPSQRTGKKQRFCNDFCRDSYHKRKKYHSVKS